MSINDQHILLKDLRKGLHNLYGVRGDTKVLEWIENHVLAMTLKEMQSVLELKQYETRLFYKICYLEYMRRLGFLETWKMGLKGKKTCLIDVFNKNGGYTSIQTNF
jgi:hypothetical protein